MSPTSDNAKSLSGRIFSSVLAFTLGIVLIFAVVMISIFYFSYEHDAERNLADAADRAAATLDSSPAEDVTTVLSQQFDGITRYTLISSSGLVLYDSQADASLMDNHATRPEVQEAATAGEAVSLRYSETVGTDTVYAAKKLTDGRIVRLSETRHSLLAFLGEMLAPVLIALVVAAGLVFLLSRLLTRHIMKPIDALDMADPLNNDIYQEMVPLLTRIDQQQAQLKRQNKELAEAETMRRDFSSNVSHEMKTPLQVISGYAELMKNDLVLPGDRQKFASLIYDEAQAMRTLINDVLTLSKLDESAFAREEVPIDVHAVAERMAQRLTKFAADQGISVQVEGKAAFISGSEALAEEMLYNLIENGVRYNREGGSVKVSVSMAPATSDDRKLFAAAGALAADAVGTTVTVRVSDTGAGIPADMQDKIFERFFRVDKSRSKETGGTGLGLAIVKHAVQYHHGAVSVESELGAGTTFVLTLPGAAAPKAASPAIALPVQA